MTARLAYLPAAPQPNSTFSVNKFGGVADLSDLDYLAREAKPYVPTLSEQIDEFEAESSAALARRRSLNGRAWRAPYPIDTEGACSEADFRRIDDLPFTYKAALLRRAAASTGYRGPLPEVAQLIEGRRYEPPTYLLSAAVAALRLERFERWAPMTAAVSLFLRPLLEHVDTQGWEWLTISDGDVIEIAEKRAKAAKARHSLRSPEDYCSPEACRERDPVWQRRQIRERIAKTDTHVAAILGLVGGRKPRKGEPDHRQLFVSNFTLARAEEARRRTRETLAQYELINADGDVLNLLSVADSKARTRRAMIYALALGIQQYGKEEGYVPVFVTCTLPGEFHPNPSKGTLSYDPALSLRDANAELSKRLQRVRALLQRRTRKREPVDYWGLWVREPHDDGCPHLHALLYVRPEQVRSLRYMFKKHFDTRHALKVKIFNRRRDDGAAEATYLMKYLLKTLPGSSAASNSASPDGQREGDVGQNDGSVDGGEDGFLDDGDHLGNISAYQAWASSIRCRRFGFIGFARGLIGRWQVIFRLKEAPEAPRLRAAYFAIRRNAWGDAMRLLGAFDRLTAAPGEARDQGPAIAMYEPKVNRYGETVRALIAFRSAETPEVFPVRPVVWTMRKKTKPILVSVIPSSPSSAPSARRRAAPQEAADPPGGPPGGTMAA